MYIPTEEPYNYELGQNIPLKPKSNPDIAFLYKNSADVQTWFVSRTNWQTNQCTKRIINREIDNHPLEAGMMEQSDHNCLD